MNTELSYLNICFANNGASQKELSKFRKYLIENGFKKDFTNNYTRICKNIETAKTHREYINKMIAITSKISITKCCDVDTKEYINFTK